MIIFFEVFESEINALF